MEFAEEHAPHVLLKVIQSCKKKDKNFTDLRDCSAGFETLFLNAWKVN